MTKTPKKKRGPNGQKWNQHLRRTSDMNRLETPETSMLRMLAAMTPAKP